MLILFIVFIQRENVVYLINKYEKCKCLTYELCRDSSYFQKSSFFMKKKTNETTQNNENSG